MRRLNRFALGLLLVLWSAASHASADGSVGLSQADIAGRFLLQTNYSEEDGAARNFMTSRSRVVRFERDGAALAMVEDGDRSAGAAARRLATIPIVREGEGMLAVDLNAGFDKIFLEEDRTGEDYYGRVDKRDRRSFELLGRKPLAVTRAGDVLVFDQEARKKSGERIVAHYYLSPYRPDPEFRPFEMTSLAHFGFYETYPQQRGGESVLYAMKFGVREPIVFALSAAIPARHREAVRDGVLYWNRALGMPLLRVVDAPAGVEAPSARYNVIQWITSGDFASTSYIQSDPLTGQILHAHVFVFPETMMDGGLEQQNDHLRYIVAHEIGHALGLRHNFAPRRITTVMDYFKQSSMLAIGRDIGAGKPALPYDAKVMRHVYLGEPLDVDDLPPFCTDGDKACPPFPSKPPPELLGIKGQSADGGETQGTDAGAEPDPSP